MYRPFLRRILFEVALVLLMLWRNLRQREGKTAATCRPLGVLHALRTVPCSLGWRPVRLELAIRTRIGIALFGSD